MSFTHLQVRSGYSLMNSTITIEKLVKKASELEFDAIALTDENVLYGAVPFYKACRKYGIKPIIGMVITILNDDEQEECIVLAKNNYAYQQLIKLSTIIQTSSLAGIEKDKLTDFTKDLIGILPIHSSKLKRRITSTSYDRIKPYIDSWEEMFAPGDFYLGIQEHGEELDQAITTATKAYGEKYQTKVVAINDVRYVNEKDDIAFDCLQAMKYGEKWKLGQAVPKLRQHHLRSTIEMEQALYSEAVAATQEIQEKCNVSFDFEKRMIPSYPVPDNTSPQEYLEKLCFANLKKRYDTVTEKIKNRLEYELDVIKSMHFSDYFLIVWDFIKYAKDNQIVVGPGRGSSAGSIVAYVLEITDVDPIKYDLLFERFLNPERVTMPDIDIDFSDQRRDEVIQYVREKYGQEHVAQIITFGTFAARSLLRELIKTIGVDQQDAYFVLKEIPAQSSKTILEHVKSSNELANYVKQSEKLRALFQVAVVLEGLPRHVSTHAAGVVISEQPLVEHVPLTIGTNETSLTQFTMTDLESIGLLKIDFLGLRNLTLLERILQSIQYTEKIHLSLNQIPEEDPTTFNLLQRGLTNGIFQLESEGMRQVLTRLKPTAFEDIVAVNALYRPGPMEFISTYIDRKHKRKEITYPHPDLKPILESTYGVLIYQEQIMQIANRIAGYSYGEADILRRAVSKKQQSIMDEQKEKFIQGCLSNGYSKEVSEELFAWIVKFSNYGFPKSHAVAYSKIAYQLAYLKTHYPKNFYAELLSSTINQHEKIHLYLNEMKDINIPILPPHINKSYGKYTVENDGIRMGLMAIKGIGNQVVKEVIRERKSGPFKHLFDFCLRISTKLVNRSTLELLIMAGTFDDTHSNRASLLASIDQAMEQGDLFREFSDQPNLFQDQLDLEITYVDIEDFTQMKKLSDEKELLGVYLSSHPLKGYRIKLRQNGYVTMDRARKLPGKKYVKSAVIVQSIKVIRTKRGDPMAFITIGDETSEMDAVIFPDLYRDINRWMKEEEMIFIQGNIEERNEKLQWILSDIQPFDEKSLQITTKQRLFIKLTDQTSKDALEYVQQIAYQYPGDTPIIIYQEDQKKTYQLSHEYNVEPSYRCLQELNQHFGRNSVVLEK
ncbi:DNA polymerase III subunit alpha [Ornithinibacillus sp. L9]|uniref:DNA polymerase III subunit alpha n=1 Tax=Ornithinibacillus caprae TaxID=2678566 RepID=A0A6N8FFQ2_9BACI|nr:DNA polymerase III subunit alpha [Ornithinibacillus caprae]MUK86867.1 DNA polymerase III subunit alpha [Ornithinibacillus caprae]